jgi:hypothetical protein
MRQKRSLAAEAKKEKAKLKGAPGIKGKSLKKKARRIPVKKAKSLSSKVANRKVQKASDSKAKPQNESDKKEIKERKKWSDELIYEYVVNHITPPNLTLNQLKEFRRTTQKYTTDAKESFTAKIKMELGKFQCQNRKSWMCLKVTTLQDCYGIFF